MIFLSKSAFSFGNRKKSKHLHVKKKFKKHLTDWSQCIFPLKESSKDKQSSNKFKKQLNQYLVLQAVIWSITENKKFKKKVKD